MPGIAGADVSAVKSNEARHPAGLFLLIIEILSK
jgi:hypothetical protein